MTPALDAWDRSAIAASLSANGFLRRSPWRDGGQPGHREWLHFTVHSPDLQLVVNLSAVDDLRPAAAPHRERVRVLVLARDARGWCGGIDEVDDADLRGGQIFARAGELVLSGDGDRIAMRGALRACAVELDLELTACTFPSVASSVAIGGSAPINWLVVPHLAVSGRATVEGRTYELDGAAGYHDHNWGYFSHHDLAWQWGHGGGHGPEHVVVARLADRAQTATFMQALLVWRGARQARVFRGHELELEPSGFLRPPRPFTLPRTAALLVSGAATDVPQRLRIRARADGDAIEGAFEAESLARIVVPHDDSLDTTAIHEVEGRLRLRGKLHGRPFRIDSPAMFEFLRSVP